MKVLVHSLLLEYPKEYKMVKHEDGKWKLYNHTGEKVLSEHSSKEDAEKREKQINFFKALETHPSLRKKLKNKSLAK